MSKAVSIKDLEDGKLINKPVHVFGWVKTFRSNRFNLNNERKSRFWRTILY